MKNTNKKGQQPMNPEDHPLYHSTWKLLKNYCGVVWSLKLAVQQVRCSFEAEFGESIEYFLDSLYLAGQLWPARRSKTMPEVLSAAEKCCD